MNKKNRIKVIAVSCVAGVMIIVSIIGFVACNNGKGNVGTQTDLATDTDITEATEVVELVTEHACDETCEHNVEIVNETDANGQVVTNSNGQAVVKTVAKNSSGSGTPAAAASTPKTSAPATKANNNYSKPATNAPTPTTATPTTKAKVPAYRCNGCGGTFYSASAHDAHNSTVRNTTGTSCGGRSEIWI